MRLLTGISIASLVVSIAAVVFVLGLYAELEKSEPDTPLVKKEHTQELTETMVSMMIRDHAEKLIKAAGITNDNQNEMIEVWESLPGFRCFWERNWVVETQEMTLYPNVYGPKVISISYNYIKTDDIWLATSIFFGCEELTTWTIDDNTGEITYGRPGD